MKPCKACGTPVSLGEVHVTHGDDVYHAECAPKPQRPVVCWTETCRAIIRDGRADLEPSHGPCKRCLAEAHRDIERTLGAA